MYFEGFYFKQQSAGAMLSLIPSVCTDGEGRTTVSLQAILPEQTLYMEWPGKTADIDRKNVRFEIEHAVFSQYGVELSIQNGRDSLFGRLRFTGVTPPGGDIMGPYRFVPRLNCRHSVYSLTHGVTGSLTVNGRVLDFSDGVGYIEGDRGRTFPGKYIWTQVGWFDRTPCSLMLSCAEVRPLGRRFVGVIGVVLYRGRQMTIATYRGAKIEQLGDGGVTVRQGDFALTAQLLSGGGFPLRAPAAGGMTRLVKENLACRARYVLTQRGRTVFDVESDRASFENEFP